jgi:hypothetical protein
MKKSLLFVALLIGGLSQLNAQCSIVPTCSITAIGYCTLPAENTALLNGTELSPYSNTIQFSLGTTVGGFATITDASITSVTGLPAGFTYSTNPVNGTIVGGTNACLILGGTPAAASAGTYTISVGFAVNTSFGPTTQTLLWFLTIDPSGTTSVKSYSSVANLFIAPNPATSELFVSALNHISKIQIIDALGKVVISHDANYSLQTTINIQTLSKGVYFLQLNDGNKVVTKKFIKD